MDEAEADGLPGVSTIEAGYFSSSMWLSRKCNKLKRVNLTPVRRDRETSLDYSNGVRCFKYLALKRGAGLRIGNDEVGKYIILYVASQQ